MVESWKLELVNQLELLNDNIANVRAEIEDLGTSVDKLTEAISEDQAHTQHNNE